MRMQAVKTASTTNMPGDRFKSTIDPLASSRYNGNVSQVPLQEVQLNESKKQVQPRPLSGKSTKSTLRHQVPNAARRDTSKLSESQLGAPKTRPQTSSNRVV